MTIAVSAERLGKSYWIPRPDAPRWIEYLTQPGDAARRARRMEVRALEEISFNVDHGEVFGIIGRNGAGKSTLLKILARITAPSVGRAKMKGRVASLLEVGTGFHPDLTGRENVYLNGMLIGMPSREVDKAFDAISDFAGVGPYINVPIKRYSSGMQLRLAFSVAAHLAADIMIIDEVLAVGDAEFQRKCLGAMRDVSSKGRTTLFVSHNMSAVESLCTRVMWLDRGHVRAIGAPEHVIQEYLASGLGEGGEQEERIDLRNLSRGWTLGGGRLTYVTFEREPAAQPRPPWRVAFGEPFSLAVGYTLDRPTPGHVIGISIRNDKGEDILTSHSADWPLNSSPDQLTNAIGRVNLCQPWLRPGTYYIEVLLYSGIQIMDAVGDAAVLVVEEQSARGAPPIALKKGMVAPVWPWSILPASESMNNAGK